MLKFVLSAVFCLSTIKPTACDYSWYINGDKSNKLKNVVYRNHAYQFPDSIMNVKISLWDEDGGYNDEPILKLRDLLHNCYNVNEMLLVDYPVNTELRFTFFNKNKEIIVIPEYAEKVYLQSI